LFVVCGGVFIARYSDFVIVLESRPRSWPSELK